MKGSKHTIKLSVTISERDLFDMLRERGVPIPTGDGHHPSIWVEVPDWTRADEGSVHEEQVHHLEVTWHVFSESILEAEKAAAKEEKSNG